MPRPWKRQRKGSPANASGRARRGLRRLARSRIVRDLVGALVILAVVVGGLSLVGGGTWPPMLVVESGSMMHGADEVGYGRVGTIDVGDIVLVRAVHGREDVRLWVDGGEGSFGRPGDVIAYAQDGDRANITIIHRAITWVDVLRTDQGTQYRLRWVDGQVRTFGSAGIYFPDLGFDELSGFTPANGYKPTYSGFLTKGDNAFTNPAVDQALGISDVVDPAWLDGRVYGEIPWMGLGKLALQVGQTNPAVEGWDRIGNAYAPTELWSMFFLVCAFLVVIPFAVVTARLVVRRRRARRALERELAQAESRAAARAR